MQLPEARPLALWLGGIYVGLGTVELITHRDDTTNALLFWGGSLVGGGALVLAGRFILDRRRALGLSLLTVGAVLGMNATVWTILIPLFAVFVLARSYRNEDAGLIVSEAPVEGPAPM
jgi:hypothetical protein